MQFALQTSQPALFTADGLDEAKLRDLMAFLQMVGEDYNMADYPEQDTMSGTAGNFGGLDTIVWYAGMSEYAQTSRAVFGYGSMTTPSWLGPPTRNCVLPDRPFCSRDFARASTCLPALRRFPPTAIRRTMRGPS